MIDNYVMTDRWLPFVKHAFFLDTEPYVADGIFIKHRLRVHFGAEFKHEAFPYVVVTGWIWVWQQERFDECMRELYAKLRSQEYVNACAVFQKIALEAADGAV